MLLPTEADAPRVLGMVKAAFAPVGGFDELQDAVLEGIATSLYGLDLADVPVADDDAVAHATEEERLHAVHLMVVLEFVEHPLSQRLALPIEEYAHGLGVSLTLLRDARQAGQGPLRVDVPRSPTAQLVRGGDDQGVGARAVGGADPLQARVHRDRRRPCDRGEVGSLRDCPAGSWGKAVADFYDRHGFPFPGERYGIYELGARHDWVHVLAGYETTPEGELDVFAFIASSMKDERGLVLLAITLGLFQNGSIHHVAGKEIKIAAPTRSLTTARSAAGSRRSGAAASAPPT